MSTESALGRVPGFQARKRGPQAAPRWTTTVPHAVVVGAGDGGIATALRLREKGYRVTPIDRCLQLRERAGV
jgi:phytoene desaturase